MIRRDTSARRGSAPPAGAARRAVHDLTRCAVLLCHAMPRRGAAHEPTPGSIYVYVAATLINASTRRPGRKTKRYSVPSIRPLFCLPSAMMIGIGTNTKTTSCLESLWILDQNERLRSGCGRCMHSTMSMTMCDDCTNAGAQDEKLGCYPTTSLVFLIGCVLVPSSSTCAG